MPIQNIEFLFFEDCPSHQEALQRLQKALREFNLDPGTIRIIAVETPQEAQRQRFPGSPTIRIDGRDIDPQSQDAPSGLACRAYRHADGRITPLPPVALIHEALRQALEQSEHPESGDPTP